MVDNWGQAFLKAISDAFSKLFSFLPDLIGALLILWIGFFIAKLLGRLVADILRKVRFNQAADKAGMSRFAQSAGVKQDASGIMGEIVKWFFRLIALVAAFSVLQLPALNMAIIGILNFIPKLIVALVIMLIGALLANVVAEFVKGAVSQSGVGNGNVFSSVARYAILYIAGVTALSQLEVAPAIIDTLWIGTIAALALAVGLAFGLGGRETAARILENGYNKAQENLPKLSNGIKQQARQQAQSANQRPTGGNVPQVYNPGGQPVGQPPVSGYAASGYTQPMPSPKPQAPRTQPMPGNQPNSNPNPGYQQPGNGYQQPNGGNYGQADYGNDQSNYPRG